MTEDQVLRRTLSQVVGLAATGAGPLPKPFQATINVTARCNGRCVYCAYGNPAHPRPTDPSHAKLVGLFRRLADYGVRSLSMSGGEPLLRADLSDLVARAVDERLTVTVVTNGSLLTEDLARALDRAGLRNLVVSLDTLDEEVYSHLRGMSLQASSDGFDKLQDYRRRNQCGFCVVVSTVLSAANTQTLLDSLDVLRGRLLPEDGMMIQAYQPQPFLATGSDPLRFRPVDRPEVERLCEALIERQRRGWPIGNSPDFLRRLPGFLADGELPAGYECRTAYTSLFIKESLDVHPCWQLPAIGNIEQTDLDVIWRGVAIEHARQRMRRLECRKCALVCHAPEFLDTLAELIGYEPFSRD